MQCPYSKVSWEKLPEIQEYYGCTYDFEIKVTSLVFHAQAFVAQCACCLIEKHKGSEARLKFINTCFRNQERYLNAEVGDKRPSEIIALFASLAKEADILDDEFTQEYFISKINDWEEAVKPAYTEHKEALQLHIYGTPKHVIGKLGVISDTESSWGVAEFKTKLENI